MLIKYFLEIRMKWKRKQSASYFFFCENRDLLILVQVGPVILEWLNLEVGGSLPFLKVHIHCSLHSSGLFGDSCVMNKTY